jgi:hypothetical protein
MVILNLLVLLCKDGEEQWYKFKQLFRKTLYLNVHLTLENTCLECWMAMEDSKFRKLWRNNCRAFWNQTNNSETKIIKKAYKKHSYNLINGLYLKKDLMH